MDEKLKEFVAGFGIEPDADGVVEFATGDTMTWEKYAQAVAAFTERRVLEELKRDAENMASFTITGKLFQAGEKKGMMAIVHLIDYRLAKRKEGEG